MTQKRLLCVGDCHGKVKEYLQICREAERDGFNTLQIGDLGFASTYATIVASGLDPSTNFCFFGNHDSYNCTNFPYNIGNFGTVPGYDDTFFVRGGFSIDKKYRTAGVNWFPEEELRWDQLSEAVMLYGTLKPRVLISHEPPSDIGRTIGNPDMLKAFGFNPDTFQTRTSIALQQMINTHPPEICIFGHFHINVDMEVDGTHYIGLGELSTCLVPKGPMTGCGSSPL